MPARPGAGTPRGTGPPLRTPSGRGRSPTQARGQAGTCRAGPAWQNAAPEQLGGAEPVGCRGTGGGGEAGRD